MYLDKDVAGMALFIGEFRPVELMPEQFEANSRVMVQELLIAHSFLAESFIKHTIHIQHCQLSQGTLHSAKNALYSSTFPADMTIFAIQHVLRFLSQPLS